MTVDSLPVTHLEPNDVVTVQTGDVGVQMRLKTFAMPITHDAPMSVGYAKILTPQRTAIRRSSR